MNTQSRNHPTAAPLTATGVPIRNLWHMLLYAWDTIDLQERWRSASEDAPTLDALLARVLADLVQQRMRIGLGRDYCGHTAELPGLRGRLDFTQSLRRMSFQHGRAVCRFQRFSADVRKNQIIRSTLARQAGHGAFGKDTGPAKVLRANLGRLVRDMESIQVLTLKSSTIMREQLRRHDRDYTLMLAVCLLLHQRDMPTETGGETTTPWLNRDALTLYAVYEKFVANFYRHHLHGQGWWVTPQKKLAWPVDSPATHLPAMQPDLTLQHRPTGRLIVLDTKFTAKMLTENQWGNHKYDSGHLYQMYAYLRSQEHRSEHHRRSTGVLLYPAIGRGYSEWVDLQGHTMRWETIDLASRWQAIESSLLGLPAAILGACH